MGKAVLSEARKLLPRGSSLDPAGVLAIEAVYWADLLNERQHVLEQRIKQAQEKLRFTFWTWISFLWF